MAQMALLPQPNGTLLFVQTAGATATAVIGTPQGFGVDWQSPIPIAVNPAGAPAPIDEITASRDSAGHPVLFGARTEQPNMNCYCATKMPASGAAQWSPNWSAVSGAAPSVPIFDVSAVYLPVEQAIWLFATGVSATGSSLDYAQEKHPLSHADPFGAWTSFTPPPPGVGGNGVRAATLASGGVQLWATGHDGSVWFSASAPNDTGSTPPGSVWTPWGQIASTGLGGVGLDRIGAAIGPTILLGFGGPLHDATHESLYPTYLFADGDNGVLHSAIVLTTAAQPTPSSVTWNKIAPPSGASACQHLTVAQQGTTLYAFAWYTDGSPQGSNAYMMSSEPFGTPGAPVSWSSWSLVATALA